MQLSTVAFIYDGDEIDVSENICMKSYARITVRLHHNFQLGYSDWKIAEIPEQIELLLMNQWTNKILESKGNCQYIFWRFATNVVWSR